MQRPRASRQRRRVRSSVHIYIYIYVRSDVKFTVRRELEMIGVHNSLAIIILITLSDGAPKHPEAPYGA